jgi:hypothetical protein
MQVQAMKIIRKNTILFESLFFAVQQMRHIVLIHKETNMLEIMLLCFTVLPHFLF